MVEQTVLFSALSEDIALLLTILKWSARTHAANAG
jgi:hypothetical protein